MQVGVCCGGNCDENGCTRSISSLLWSVCRHLSEILSQNVTLQKLYLGYNDIRDDGVYALIAAMRPQGQLEVSIDSSLLLPSPFVPIFWFDAFSAPRETPLRTTSFGAKVSNSLTMTFQDCCQRELLRLGSSSCQARSSS